MIKNRDPATFLLNVKNTDKDKRRAEINFKWPKYIE